MQVAALGPSGLRFFVMSLSHLPVIQNWDCTACGSCCRQYTVTITEEEYLRIVAQGWTKEELDGLEPVVRSGWLKRVYRLNHRPTGECVFLGGNNRCRIHERFGAEGKPLACRLYPFALVPAGDHWRVAYRFACPSAAANRGRPTTEHTPELTLYAHLLERQEGHEPREQPPPALDDRQTVDWPDVFRLVHALLELLKNRADAVERRVRKCLALAAVCRKARFDTIRGSRLGEFLDLVTSYLDAEVPADLAKLAAPSWIGRVLFRQLAAIYARRDHGEWRGSAQRRRWSLFLAGCRFGLGSGPVPLVNGRMRPATFADMDAAAGPLPTDADAVLERYFLVKVESLQFCGPTNFGLSFWDGFEALALTLPTILWLSRNFTNVSRAQAIMDAVCYVDDHFGYNRVLNKSVHRFAMRTLAHRGELARLIGWYSR